MAALSTVIVTEDQDEEYFGDVFNDERVLLEELDLDDFLSDSSSANQEFWDILEISDEEWADAQPEGFFMR